jgi:hypothetical protein
MEAPGMTRTYGPFLLRGISGDAVATEAQCLQLLEQFAQKKFCSVFREIIGERVVEFRTVNGAVSYDWLEGEAAEAVRQVQGHRGWAPYSFFDYLDGMGTVLTPSGNREGEATLSLDTGKKFEMFVSPAAWAIGTIRDTTEYLKQKDPAYWETVRDPLELYLELYDSLISGLEACRKAGVIYRLD